MPGRRPPSLKDRLCDLLESAMDLFVRLVGPVLSILCLGLIAMVTRSYFVDVLPLLSARVCHGATDETLRKYAERTEYAPATMRGRQGILDARSGRFLIADFSNNPNAIEDMLAAQQSLLVEVDTSSCGTTNVITAFGIYILCNLLFHYFATMLLGPGRPPARLSQEVELHLATHDPERRDDQHIRACRVCKSVKPMRTHHCRACRKCGLKMDHHCQAHRVCMR
jgi:hypothetical protein